MRTGVWFLLGAIGVEVAATSLMPATRGFSRPLPTALCLAGYALAFFFFALALRDLPVGLSYAVWSGLGTVLVVLIGVLFLHEQQTRSSLLGVLLVLGGVVLIHLGGLSSEAADEL